MKSNRSTLSFVCATLLLLVLFASPQAARAGSCTAQAGTRTDPTTGWTFGTLWYCGNAAGAQMYVTPSKSQPAAVMNSTTSWFACYERGDVHNGGNNVWYYSLGDRPAGIWGYMPAESVWTDVDPWPGIPRCPDPPNTVARGRVRGDPVAVANIDGRMEVFTIGWDNAVWHSWQTSAGGAWTAWESLGGWADQLAVARNSDGRVQVFVRGADRAVHSRSQIIAGNRVYDPWEHQGGSVLRFAAAQNLDGRLELFGIGAGNVPYHIWQTSPGGGWNSAWDLLPGWADQLGVARNLDGRLEVFVRGSDRAMYGNAQVSPGGSWSGWIYRAGTLNQLAAARNANGELETFTIGPTRAVLRNHQVGAGSGTWSGWSSIGGSVDRLAVAQNLDGRLEVFGRNADGALVRSAQTSSSSGFGAWASEGGVIYQPAVARNRDGRLEVFVRGTDSRIHHKRQTTAGGAWSSWSGFPTLIPAPTNCWNDPPDWFGHIGAGGPRSDPINLIICFGHGRTWNALFAELAKLKTTNRQGELLGFERIYDSPIPYPPNHCIHTIHANVQSGPAPQDFSAREGGCDLDALYASGIDHFRAWAQSISGSLFLSASTEDDCEFVSHCVLSYDDGRDLLTPWLEIAATNAGWPAPTTTSVRVTAGGTITQANGSAAPYDGTVTVIMIN